MGTAESSIMSYRTENMLVKAFCELLGSDDNPWGKLTVTREFNYRGGRTDVIAVDVNDHVIAFEMKLLKWTDAMYQAYKNTSFAHCSYVVLPEATAERARLRMRDFTRRSVGICAISDGEIIITLPAIHQSPIRPWLARTVISQARDRNEQGVEE